MITNADITLYNHYYDKKTRLDHWQRSVIRGVHFYVDHRVSIGDSGVNSGYVYKIRIPVMCRAGILISRRMSGRPGDAIF